jgi:hypothetical protein
VVAGGFAAIAIAAVGVGVVGMSEPSQPTSAVASAPPSSPAAPQPSTPPATPRSRLTPSIDSEKTDREPLRLRDVFPPRPLSLGGRNYKQDKTSVNHQCSLVARGDMARALVRGRCRSVVRATYVDSRKRLAVTAGVVAMPSRRMAVAVRRSGDPSEYEWFRGMVGTVAENIDQAGGYAASTVRGRFIIYSYATYVDGRAAANDPLLARVGRQFVGYAVRPIEQRAR